jgi:hypothetical protein
VTTPEPEHDAAGVSAPGSVVLDIGPGVGALVLHTPPDLEGAEIEISLAAHGAARTHSQVRKRVTSGKSGASADTDVSYAGVYPSLAAGSYTIWRDADTAAGVATVPEAQVTTWHWPASADGGPQTTGP